MPDGGLDIATLGLRVDAREFVDATKSVDEFTDAGVRAERQTRATERAATEFARRQDFVQRHMKQTKEAVDALAKARLDEVLEVTGEKSRLSATQVARLGNVAGDAAREFAGLSSNAAGVVDGVASLALSGGVVAAAIAGLSAIRYLWTEITRESREAKRAQEEALARLGEAASLRDLGPAGSVARDVADAQAAIAALKAERARLEAGGGTSGTRLGLAIGAGNELAAEAADAARFERIKKINEEIEDAEERAAEGILQIRENTTREQERINAEQERIDKDRARSAAQAARDAEQLAERLQRLASETARREQVSANVVANLDQQIDAETRLLAANQRGADAVEAVNRELEREQALREALANAVPADVARIERQVNALYDLKEANEEAADLRERTSKEFIETGKQLEAAWDRLRQQERERAEQAATLAQAWRDAWVDAAVDIGRAISDSAGNAAAFLGNLDIGNAIGGGGLAALNPIAIPGFLAGGVVGILSGREERARAVEQARLEFERVLDAYVDELADATRWERLEADALSGAQDAFSSLLDSLFADLASRGSFGAEAAQRIKDQLSGAVDLAGLEAVLSQFGPQGQAILEEYRKKLERIEEQRQKEIETMSQNLQVETLRLQGLDEEANALALSIRYHDLMAQALELNDSALQALIESWYEAAQAADEAAKAAEAEAKAKRDAATRDDFLANLGILQAENAGDDLGAFQAAQEFAAKQKIAEAQRLFAEGIIDEDTLNAFIEAIGVQLTNALKDAEEAAIAAAEAEQFRAYQDMQNLQIRLLIAQGMTEEAFLLRQRLELEEAIAAGRSEAYIALLLQVQAEERAARERARNAAALQAQNRAMEESTRSIDGMTRALNGPAGLVLALRRFQTIRGAGAPNALGIDAPTYQGRGGASIQIAEGAIVIQGGTQDPKAIADAVVNRITQEARAGAGNRVVNVIA